ncbi:MAG: hypothetical protein IJA34_00720 [Lachnospiraceae bacterium]|nr:hypothetical protein [Lachnospiraceae bacterium]
MFFDLVLLRSVLEWMERTDKGGKYINYIDEIINDKQSINNIIIRIDLILKTWYRIEKSRNREKAAEIMKYKRVLIGLLD